MTQTGSGVRVRRRLGLAAGAVIGLLGLLGCTRLPGQDTLFLYMENDGISREKEAGENRRVAAELIAGFQRLHPEADIHIRHFPSESFVAATRFRTSHGLGPDLMLTRVPTAMQLSKDGLSVPVSVAPDSLKQIRPRFLEMFHQGNRLQAIPVVARSQVACYDNQRLENPPQSLEQLITLSANGLRVGLPLSIPSLYWTSSGLEANDALVRLLEARPSGEASPDPVLSAGDQAAIRRWLQWLTFANLQRNVVFTDEVSELVRLLEEGRLDWISCEGVWLDQLSAKLGSRLGVSVLPGREGQPAQPLNRLMVWSYGRDSSSRQRELAERFVLFTLREVNQKRLMELAPGNLPVNPRVLIPTKSSRSMAALDASLSHSRMLDFRDPERILERLERMQGLLRGTIAGESSPEEVVRAMLGEPGGP